MCDATPFFIQQMVTWQIVSGLRQAHSFRGGGNYPYPFNHFVNVIEVVMFDFFTFFHTECVSPTTYDEKLMVSLITMAAFGLVAVIIAKISVLMFDGTGVLQSPSMKGYILLIYTVLPTMSSMAFSAFNVDRVREEEHPTDSLSLVETFVSFTHQPSHHYPGSTTVGQVVARRS